MAVQKVILTETLTGLEDQPVIYNETGSSESKEAKLALSGSMGALALGKPGDIWSRAYGPLVYAMPGLAEAVEFGTVVDGYGLLVNGNDVANESPRFEATTKLAPGQTGAFMVSGAAVVLCKNVADILDKMNARVIMGYTEEFAENDVCVVEVNGFKADGGQS